MLYLRCSQINKLETGMPRSKCPWRLHKLLARFALAFLLAYVPTEAVAACSDSKIKSLSRQGKTVATIARFCGMNANEVRDILEQNDEEEDEPAPSRRRPPARSQEPGQSGGLAPGTALAPCGCWGPVAPGHGQPNQACKSGYAMPRMCPQMCPAGGYAWQGVCG